MTNSRQAYDKEQLREDLRRSMEHQGPLYFNNKYKDENYAYYFELYDSQKPFKFQTCIDLGYEYTKTEDCPGLVDSQNSIGQKFNLVDDMGNIGVRINNHQIQYLMKMSIERWHMLQEVRNEEYNKKVAKYKHSLKSSTILGEVKMSSGELKSSKYS